MAQGHLGPKAQKLAWIDDTFTLTSGFNKQAEREYAIWDQRNIGAPVVSGAIGDGMGVGHLYFDREHNLLFMAGRGEMKIGIYQYESGKPLIWLSDYLHQHPQKGFNMMPKWSCDVNNHEVSRGVRLNNDKSIEYIAFSLPNRTGLF